MSEAFGAYAVEVANTDDVGFIAEYHGKTFTDIESAVNFARAIPHILAWNVIDSEGHVVRSYREPRASAQLARFARPQQIEEE